MSWADIYPTLQTALAPSIKMFFGAQYLSQQEAPNRIVWVPSHDRFTDPLRTRSSDKRRISRDRLAGMDFYFWFSDGEATAEDHYRLSYKKAEDALHEFLCAFLVLTGIPASLLEEAIWLGPSDYGWLTLGAACVLRVQKRAEVFTSPVTPLVVDPTAVIVTNLVAP